MENYDALARGVMAGSQFRACDVVYEHPTTQAKVYIGNISAAESLDILREKNITRVVNCQQVTSANFHETDPLFEYYRFDVSAFHSVSNICTDPVIALRFFNDVFSWIDKQVSENNNVLIHCLAGAHRAGTTGVAYVMWTRRQDPDMSFSAVLAYVKQCRPIVDPFGRLSELLRSLEPAIRAAGKLNKSSG